MPAEWVAGSAGIRTQRDTTSETHALHQQRFSTRHLARDQQQMSDSDRATPRSSEVPRQPGLRPPAVPQRQREAELQKEMIERRRQEVLPSSTAKQRKDDIERRKKTAQDSGNAAASENKSKR